MKLPKRFTLSTLLLVMLLVSLVFGYAQWRRQWLIQQVSEIERSVYTNVGLIDNLFWPTVPKHAVVCLFETRGGACVGPPSFFLTKARIALSDGKHHTKEEVERYFLTSRDKLNAIGVTHVQFAIWNVTRGWELMELND